jgi:hypothetical protein
MQNAIALLIAGSQLIASLLALGIGVAALALAVLA